MKKLSILPVLIFIISCGTGDGVTTNEHRDTIIIQNYESGQSPGIGYGDKIFLSGDPNVIHEVDTAIARKLESLIDQIPNDTISFNMGGYYHPNDRAYFDTTSPAVIQGDLIYSGGFGFRPFRSCGSVLFYKPEDWDSVKKQSLIEIDSFWIDERADIVIAYRYENNSYSIVPATQQKHYRNINSIKN